MLQQAEGFGAKAAVEASIGMHLHLQEHHWQRFATAGLLAGPEHTIGMVGHLFEGHRPEDVGRFPCGFGLRAGTGAGVCSDQPRQEMTHQIRHGPEHLGIPVITWQGSGWIGQEGR